MTGKQFRKIRVGLGLSASAWGRALGYQGALSTMSRQVRRYEAGEREIPEWIARLARMYERYGVPKDWL